MKKDLTKEAYVLAPDVFLTKYDEQTISIFLSASGNMAEAKIGMSIPLLDGTAVVFYSPAEWDKKTKKPSGAIRLTLWVNNQGKYYIPVRELNNKLGFAEISQETGEFLNKYFSYKNKWEEFKKLEEALKKIFDNKYKRNGMAHPDKKKDPKACVILKELHTLEAKKEELISTQKYEEAARTSGVITKVLKKLSNYLIRTYPKRKILKSKFLKEALLSKRKDLYEVRRGY